jgi:hypothetical protein
MSLAVKQDEALDAADIGLLCTIAVVLGPRPFSNLVEEAELGPDFHAV